MDTIELDTQKFEKLYKRIQVAVVEKDVFRYVNDYADVVVQTPGLQDEIKAKLILLNYPNENQIQQHAQKVDESLGFMLLDVSNAIKTKRLKGMVALLKKAQGLEKESYSTNLEYLEARYQAIKAIFKGLIKKKKHALIEKYFRSKGNLLSEGLGLGFEEIPERLSLIKQLGLPQNTSVSDAYQKIMTSYMFYNHNPDLYAGTGNMLDRVFLTSELESIKRGEENKRTFFKVEDYKNFTEIFHQFLLTQFSNEHDEVYEEESSANVKVYRFKSITLSVDEGFIRFKNGRKYPVDINRDDVKFLCVLLERPNILIKYEEFARLVNPSWYSSESLKPTIRENCRFFKRNLGRYLHKIGMTRESSSIIKTIKSKRNLGYTLM